MWPFEKPQLWFTYGPSVDNDEILTSLFGRGATGVRLTFSYGTPDLQHERALRVRQAAARAGVDTPMIVADLEGEKPRLAKIDGLPEEHALAQGEVFRIVNRNLPLSFDDPQLGLRNPGHFAMFSEGDTVIVGDGSVVLRVLETASEFITCSVRRGGKLNAGRGLAVQSTAYRPAALGPKDRSDLGAILANAHLYDAVAISFVANEGDVASAADVARAAGVEIPIVAKVETKLGVENIDSICGHADAVMIARGDLALATPWIDLFDHCQTIARSATDNTCPWILATQVAEGLERFDFPTRAEICDLAHWTSQGADGVMLSYETAFGARPVDAVGAVHEVMTRYAQP